MIASVGQGADCSLWAIEQFGKQQAQLTDHGGVPGCDDAPAWSPDGKRLVFRRTATDAAGAPLGVTWVVLDDPVRSRSRSTSAAPSPRRSPGSRGASSPTCDPPPGQPPALAVMNADGTGRRTLYSASGLIGSPCLVADRRPGRDRAAARRRQHRPRLGAGCGRRAERHHRHTRPIRVRPHLDLSGAAWRRWRTRAQCPCALPERASARTPEADLMRAAAVLGAGSPSSPAPFPPRRRPRAGGPRSPPASTARSGSPAARCRSRWSVGESRVQRAVGRHLRKPVRQGRSTSAVGPHGDHRPAPASPRAF